MSSETKRVIVVGGSIAGLMHGIVCKALGYNVIILEGRKEDQMNAQAAGIGLRQDAIDLLNRYVTEDSNAYCITSPSTQIRDRDGTVMLDLPNEWGLENTNWSMLFQILRASFEDQSKGGGNTTYLTGTRVVNLQEEGDQMAVLYETNGNVFKESSDIIIAADGARSSLRSILGVDFQPEYAGYLAWRGYVPQSSIPKTFERVLDGDYVWNMLVGGYILLYLTPGTPGTTSAGDRIIEWCWYDYHDAEVSSLDDVMTDKVGHRHQTTVPKGYIRKEVWDRRIERARKVLPAPWLDLVINAQLPLITKVTSFTGTQVSFKSGKVFVVGEAFTQFRPHLGLGCNLPAKQALLFSEVLQGNLTIEEWEVVMVQYANEFSVRSTATGNFGMTGKWPEGYSPSYVRKMEKI